MREPWICSKCQRAFAQKNQRHACGTGDRGSVLRNRPESVVRLYEAIESYAKSLGDVEVVARDRYVLLRSVRIFVDLQIMVDAVRVAIHLPKQVNDQAFIKVVPGPRFTTHVAKLRTDGDWQHIKRYVKEAYEATLA